MTEKKHNQNMKTKKLPITAAKQIGNKYSKNQVIIIAYDERTETTTVTTWGKTVEDSENAAIAGNAYKKALGFPAEKCNDVPARVRAKAKPRKKRTPRVKPVNHIMALYIPSEALSALVGPKPISRVDVVKKLWGYIKENGLQDKKNRRMINLDELLRPVFDNKEQVSMFEMAKHLQKNLKEVKK